jgi:hypothetical protein
MKCPHKELLSVYIDGELPSPWKEKMERHVALCASCAGALEVYKTLSLKPSNADIETANAAKERVWQKLELGATAAESGTVFKRGIPDSGAIWRRRLSIPLPAAAAAAVLFIALAAFFILRTPGTAETPDVIIASETEFDAPGIIPVSDMASVLQYLGSRDTGDTLILRLPDSRNFVNSGEPAIIRAADYPQRMSNRQRPDRQPGRRPHNRQIQDGNAKDWRKP